MNQIIAAELLPSGKEGSAQIHGRFDEAQVLHKLRHYLPAQAPLKDFIHHNTLHAFQDKKFHDALRFAAISLGYNTSLSLQEFRDLYKKNKISDLILDRVLQDSVSSEEIQKWKNLMFEEDCLNDRSPRIGATRALWKKKFKMDLDSMVHPILFRTLCSYLDQGIAIWNFPAENLSFLEAIIKVEENGFVSFFREKRVKQLLKSNPEISQLLGILLGNSHHYANYIFDQQFAHPGWSGMVAVVEEQPETLLDKKLISLHDLIIFELLLEIDALDSHFPEGWTPLLSGNDEELLDVFADVNEDEYSKVLSLWQEAYEWTFYDQVLSGLKDVCSDQQTIKTKSFQAIFCIDDRECSLRRYLENTDSNCETFSTPGFFGVEFYFQPADGEFLTKLCPAPVTPKYLIKEVGVKNSRKQDLHFSKHSHHFIGGWLISQTIGFWSALKLFANILRPTLSPAAASSFQHMDKASILTIEAEGNLRVEQGLQVGFTVEEMTIRVESVLSSIGLVKDFAPIVYVVGHGASSVNNPHYAAYDCGACSGRAGSVNARVFCHMANHTEVRKNLALRGIVIPNETQFVGALHDTTRDEIQFYDEVQLSNLNRKQHELNHTVFEKSLTLNAKERSRRFEYVNTSGSDFRVHEVVKRRSVSLFEPRPELNHATNAVCVVGRRELTKNLFLDRRSFLNSYDYRIDPDGKYLTNILNAAAPVCGGINLEYFFSRVDNTKLGAGTKLPHNVMGLFGVANGIDGDLRTGLPMQMIEVHDPVRLLIVVEHDADVVMSAIKRNPATWNWFANEWVRLVVVTPLSNKLFVLNNEEFYPYQPLQRIGETDELLEIIHQSHDNIPVLKIKNS